MAGSSRRLTVAVFALPFLFLAMSGLANAVPINVITVNTLDGGHDLAPLCTLQDAVFSANSMTSAPGSGCAAGNGLSDVIEFTVSGTILLTDTLSLTDPNLSIVGPQSNGITITTDFAGEIMLSNSADLTLKNLTLALGDSVEGAALFAESSNVLIEDCTFYGNEADEGAAIFADGEPLTIINSTFFDNVADAGAAIFNNGSTLSITNVTFDDNGVESGFGADIFTASGDSAVNNSIFADSLGGNCDGVDDQGYNISDDDSCGFAAPSVNSSTTLNLDSLNSNGGPTQTVALGTGSQAIDFIPIAHCIDFALEPVTTDQRGFGRPDPLNLNFCDVGAYEAGAVPTFTIVPNSERVQIARSASANSDQVNLALTFGENGAPTCQSDQDALNEGFDLALYEGECGGNLTGGLSLSLTPFVVHTVNHQSYGTLFQSMPPETVSARMVSLRGQTAPSCGEWTLNLEVSGLDTDALGLGGTGTDPYAIVLTTTDGAFAGCFDVTNPIVGNQIDPPSRTIRRGLRR